MFQYNENNGGFVKWLVSGGVSVFFHSWVCQEASCLCFLLRFCLINIKMFASVAEFMWPLTTVPHTHTSTLHVICKAIQNGTSTSIRRSFKFWGLIIWTIKYKTIKKNMHKQAHWLGLCRGNEIALCVSSATATFSWSSNGSTNKKAHSHYSEITQFAFS